MVKNYNLDILDEKEWEEFKKNYSEAGLGSNLDKAISGLIKNFNKGGLVK